MWATTSPWGWGGSDCGADPSLRRHSLAAEVRTTGLFAPADLVGTAPPALTRYAER